MFVAKRQKFVPAPQDWIARWWWEPVTDEIRASIREALTALGVWLP